jgi:hypothetical protein
MLPRFNYRLWKPQCLRALRTTTRLLGRHSEKAALELYQQQLLMHAEPDLFDHPNTAMKKVCSTFVCSLPSTSASFSCTSSGCYFPSAQLFLPYGFMCVRARAAVLCCVPIRHIPAALGQHAHKGALIPSYRLYRCPQLFSCRGRVKIPWEDPKYQVNPTAGKLLCHGDSVVTCLCIAGPNRVISCSDDKNLIVWQVHPPKVSPSLFHHPLSLFTLNDGLGIRAAGTDTDTLSWSSHIHSNYTSSKDTRGECGRAPRITASLLAVPRTTVSG